MKLCDICGEEIIFRHVGGGKRVYHLSGRCGGQTSLARRSEPARSGYVRADFDGACWLTKCPNCQDPVFFIRHNGGSLWVDPPLGPPWPEHCCMADIVDSPPAKVSRAVVEIPPVLVWGVIVLIEAGPHKADSYLHIDFGGSVPVVVHVRGYTNILGCRVLYNRVSREVTEGAKNITRLKVID